MGMCFFAATIWKASEYAVRINGLLSKREYLQLEVRTLTCLLSSDGRTYCLAASIGIPEKIQVCELVGLGLCENC